MRLFVAALGEGCVSAGWTLWMWAALLVCERCVWVWVVVAVGWCDPHCVYPCMDQEDWFSAEWTMLLDVVWVLLGLVWVHWEALATAAI